MDKNVVCPLLDSWCTHTHTHIWEANIFILTLDCSTRTLLTTFSVNDFEKQSDAGDMVGWLEFNGTFSTELAISCLAEVIIYATGQSL